MESKAIHPRPVMVGANQVHARLDSAKIAKLQVQHADRGKGDAFHL